MKKSYMLIFLIILFLTLPSTISFDKINNDKPDLEIVAIGTYIIGTGDEYMLIPKVINNGNVPLQVNSEVIRLTVKKFLSTEIIHNDIYSTGCNYKHEPGEIKEYIVYGTDLMFGIYRCYFEVDLNNRYDEEDEDNNKVWAYYFMPPRFIPYRSPKQIGPLRTSQSVNFLRV